MFAGLTASVVNRSPDAVIAACYLVTVVTTGEQFTCPAQKPILDAAHAANILISYSCRSGQCGSCLGKLLRGEIEYPRGLPQALSQQQHEAGYALFCSARATSDLLIDLIEPGFRDG